MRPVVLSVRSAGSSHSATERVDVTIKIDADAAKIGLVRGLQQRRAAGDGEIQHGVDLLDGAAIPGERRSAKVFRPRLHGEDSISEFMNMHSNDDYKVLSFSEQTQLLSASLRLDEMIGRQFRTALVETELFAGDLKPPSDHPRH